MTVKFHYDLMQGGDAWLQARHGLLTASTLKMLLTPAKLEVAKNADVRLHVHEITSQRLSSNMLPHYESWEMARGHTEERYASDLYSQTYSQLKDCGFVTNDKWGFTLGYSPDGMVMGLNGAVEIKSRNAKYQVQTILANEVPSEHMIQIQAGMLVAELEFMDFISYSNGMPMFVKRVMPDDKIQKAIIEAAKLFEKQVKDNIESYKELTKNMVVAEWRDPETEGEIKI